MNYWLGGWGIMRWVEYIEGNALYELLGSQKVSEGFL